MTTATEYAKVYGSALTLIKLTKGEAVPNGCCRGLLVGTPGTANIKDGTGAARTNVPLQAGYNPICVTSLDASGTADDIWALY